MGQDRFRLVQYWSEPYHAGLGEDVASPRVHRRALAGVPVAEAAASHHHVVKSVVIFVFRVPASSPQQCVAQSEEAGEVHTDICHRDQIYSGTQVKYDYNKQQQQP